MKKEDFNLKVPDGSLTLTGERKFEERSMASNIIALNVWQASSRAPFFLPDREKRCD
jgi:HSP20 family molecular chaperone IbpA